MWKISQPALGPMRFAKKRLISRGVDVIDLGSFIPEVPEAVAQSIERSKKFPNTIAADEHLISHLKQKIVDKHQPLSAIGIDPETEIVITPGIQMTASLLTLSTLNPGDVAAFPDPGMQYFRTAVCLADAGPGTYALSERNDYIPNISLLAERSRKKLKMLFVNYPHDPTTSTVDSYFYRDLLKSIKFENVLIVSDSAYIHPGDRDGVSILHVKGSRKKAVELHSFSTVFGIKGLGFAVGHRDVILVLGDLLRALGFCPDVYRAGLVSTALDNSLEIFEQRAESLRTRREIAASYLKELGWRIRGSKNTPFLWVKPTARSSSLALARRLFTKAGVRVAPGSDFGEGGEGWLRLTLRPDEGILAEALKRIAHHSKIWQRKYRPQ